MGARTNGLESLGAPCIGQECSQSRDVRVHQISRTSKLRFLGTFCNCWSSRLGRCRPFLLGTFCNNELSLLVTNVTIYMCGLEHMLAITTPILMSRIY